MCSHKREWISVLLHALFSKNMHHSVNHKWCYQSRAALLLQLYMRQFVNLFCFNGERRSEKGEKKGEKQSIKRTHENGLSFEANDDRADLLSNEQHLKARLSSILSYKIGLKRLQKRLIKKGINHLNYPLTGANILIRSSPNSSQRTIEYMQILQL